MKASINILIICFVLVLNVSGQEFHLPEKVNPYDILGFCLDEYNNECISTSDGIYLRQLDEWRFLTTNELFRPNKKIYECDIRFDNEGKLWIANWNGVGYYYHEKWKILNIPNKISRSVINAINIDREGKYWIGTNRGIWVKRKIIGWKLHEKLGANSLNRVNDIEIDKKGLVWISIAESTGSDGMERTEGGVSYYNGQWNSIDISSKKLYKDNGENLTLWTGYKHIKDISMNPEGEIWILNGNGQLMKYYEGEIKIYWDKSKSCNHFAVDSNDSIHCIGNDYFIFDIEVKNEKNLP